MKHVYSACIVRNKDKEVLWMGNHINRTKESWLECIGATPIPNTIELTYDEGVVNVEARIEDYPFDDAYEMWVYGHAQRLSTKEPKFSKRQYKDGRRRIMAMGDCWLNCWSRADVFGDKPDIFKVWMKIERTDKEER